MSEDLKAGIKEWLGEKVDAVGLAPLDRFGDAPERHHPSRICKDARTVIVLGKTVPRGVLHSPDYGLHFLHRSYHSVYCYLDELGLMLSDWIESQGSYLAVPIPSFAPLVFKGPEPWGILSLKHAAVQAGLGAIGKSGLMYHPTYGSLLRLGAVVTSAKLPGDPLISDDLCPPECRACWKVCPARAFNDEGSFSKLTCQSYTVKHAIYPIAFRTEEDLKHIERIINTAGYNYWLACDECLKVCPINRGKQIDS
ncbi:MAG: epoxyqueuosine reductase [Deltaproteobacteria bacterium]|nr:MAG: epoxyqueuosine reductase [Deltaproteobacteria bacterium]